MSLALFLGIGLVGAVAYKARRESLSESPPLGSASAAPSGETGHVRNEDPQQQDDHAIADALEDSGLVELAVQETVKFVAQFTRGNKTARRGEALATMDGWNEWVWENRELLAERVRNTPGHIESALMYLDAEFPLPTDIAYKFAHGETTSSWYRKYYEGRDLYKGPTQRHPSWLFEFLYGVAGEVPARIPDGSMPWIGTAS